MIVCRHIRYSGRVQGVGFRYTCRRLAERFRVAGYVRNLPSGEVEVVVEGEEDEVRKFLDAVAQQLSGYIEGQVIEDRPLEGFKVFSIRH